MFRARSLTPGVCLLALTLGLTPALSGCGSSDTAGGGTAGMTPEEAKAKADQETQDAFKQFQKEQRAKKR